MYLATGSNELSGVYKQKITKLDSDLTAIEGVFQMLRRDKRQTQCEDKRDTLACDERLT